MKNSLPEYKIIEKYFYKNFKLQYRFEENLDNFFEKFKGEYSEIFNNIFEIEPIYFSWKEYSFPVFIHNNEKELYAKDGKISFDIYLNTFLFLSSWQEIINTKRDLHNRFPYDESLQKKYSFVEIPIVNIYFELLYEIALKNDVNISKVKVNEPFILSHDIDQLRSAWFENIQYEMANFSFKSFFIIPKNVFGRFLGFKDSYFIAMKKMLKIDKEKNIKAISFLMPVKSHKDADFEITDKDYSSIIQKTCNLQTIGIHPGYDTFDNKKEYENQLKKLEKITNKKITKSRQHFLRYDVNITPHIQEEIGILEDYTLGFAEQYGFRNAVANPFFLFNFTEQKAFNIKQFPLVFMDVSLMHYSLEKEFEGVLVFLESIKKTFNCHFSILFHNSVFTNGKYKGFEEFYLKIKMLAY